MTKLKKCPVCGSGVELIEDTVGREAWRLEIVCGCGLRKLRQPAILESVAPYYDEWKEQLCRQWNHRPQLEEAYEALRAYNIITACPGFLIQPGAASGCANFDPSDCPTCAVIDAAENY